MIFITPSIRLQDSELSFAFIRASGPGGQHVNKTATAVQLRFHIYRSPSLPDEVKKRLVRLGGSRVTTDGELIIEARRFRSQDANRRDALERLKALIMRAGRRPRIRRKTKPTAGSRQRRLTTKRMQSTQKKLRGKTGMEDW